jgi:hypothetical protein
MQRADWDNWIFLSDIRRVSGIPIGMLLNDATAPSIRRRKPHIQPFNGIEFTFLHVSAKNRASRNIQQLVWQMVLPETALGMNRWMAREKSIPMYSTSP